MSMTLDRDTSTETDPRWARVLARDRSADGVFWYSVRTTGVYCRPSCPSRGANPRNVGLHDSLEDARATGCRPCKRCNPDGPSAEARIAALVADACRLIEAAESPPALDDVAKAAGLSPGYFHRQFKAVTGLTPKGYATAYRAGRVREGLASGAGVTEAIYDAGFNSSGRFYAQSTDMLGMTPSRYRAGGADEELRFAVGQCSLGAILVASSDKGVAAILLGDDPDALVRDLQDRFPRARLVGGDGDYEALVARVVGLVEAPGLRLVVDTCVGNDKPRHALGGNALATPFLQHMADAGWTRDSVDTVVCTHLHVDHVGWNTMLEDGKWVPTFPKAKYLFGKTELAHWNAHGDEEDKTILSDSVQPILDAGLAQMVDLDHRISPEVRLIPTTGHTPGHVSVLIESEGQTAVITGDMTHHPYQLAEPHASSSFDVDRDASSATREKMFAEWADSQILVIGTHYAAPTAGRIQRDGAAFRFEG